MPTLDQIFNITVNLGAAGLEGSSFNKALVLGTKQAFPELVREYATATFATDMVADGFAATDPEYLVVQSIASQNNRPPNVKVGRRTNLPTQAIVFTVPDATPGRTYTVTINGTDYSVPYAATTADTPTLIAGLLEDAITAAGLTDVTVTDNVDGTFDFDVSTAGLLYVCSATNVQQDDQTADGGIATDLAAVLAEDDQWYHLLSVTHSDAEIEAASTWVAANSRRFTAATSNPDSLGTSAGAMFDINAAGERRTVVVYSEEPYSGKADGGIIGRMANFDPPGRADYDKKQVVGPVAASITNGQKNNILGKNASYYNRISGITYFNGGNGGGGTPLDVTEGIDWFVLSLQQRWLLLLLNAERIPYTDRGIAQLRAEIDAQLAAGVSAGIISAIDADGNPPQVVVPTKASQSPVDIANRLLKGFQINFELAGSVRRVQATINAQF